MEAGEERQPEKQDGHEDTRAVATKGTSYSEVTILFVNYAFRSYCLFRLNFAVIPVGLNLQEHAQEHEGKDERK